MSASKLKVENLGRIKSAVVSQWFTFPESLVTIAEIVCSPTSMLSVSQVYAWL